MTNREPWRVSTKNGLDSHFHLSVDSTMKTAAYLRVSTGSQNLDNQKLAILDYARQKQLVVDRFVEAPAIIQSAKRKPDLA